MPSGCDPVRTNPGQSPGQAHKKGSPKPLPLANLGEPMHRGARAEGKGLEPSTGYPAPDFESSGNCVNAEENAHSLESAAQGAAASAVSDPIDADLRAIIDAWPALAVGVRADVLAIIELAGA